MKKLLLGSLVLTAFACAFTIFQLSCVKSTVAQQIFKTDTVYINTCTTDSIVGLWIGTYTDITPATLPYNLTVYPDGTISYKGLGEDNYTYFASGTWSLIGTAFSYSVTTVNHPSGIQHIQNGTAIYNRTNGTLTNGAITDITDGSHSTFIMTRFN